MHAFTSFNPDAFISRNSEYYNSLLTVGELDSVIHSAGNTFDIVYYSFFRHLSDRSKLFIFCIFIALFSGHLFPDWNESVAIALPKNW